MANGGLILHPPCALLAPWHAVLNHASVALTTHPPTLAVCCRLWAWGTCAINICLADLATHPAGIGVLRSFGYWPALCNNALLEDLARCTGLRKLQLPMMKEIPADEVAGGPGAAAGGGGGGAAAASAAAQAGMLDLTPLSSLSRLEELVLTQAAGAYRLRWVSGG